MFEPETDREPLNQFARLLKANHPSRSKARVLDIGTSDGGALKIFQELGFEAEGVDTSGDPVQKLGMLTLPRESCEGIWANRSLSPLTPVLCQRVVQTFFAALRSKGILFVSFRLSESQWTEIDFESMLRQSGYGSIWVGKPVGETDLVAMMAQRI